MTTLINIDRAQNKHRFYTIHVAPTLFGEWSIMREWGRVGSPGTVRLESYRDEAAAREAERITLRMRERHGYT